MTRTSSTVAGVQVNVRFPPGHPVENVPPGDRAGWVRNQVTAALEVGDALRAMAAEVAALRRAVEVLTERGASAGSPARVVQDRAGAGRRMEGWDDL